MPFVRISTPAGITAATKTALSDTVHQALTATFNVPVQDRFQVIEELTPGSLICAPEYLGIAHSDKPVFIQVDCNVGRTVEMKKALFKRLAELISSRTDFRAEDVIVHLVEVQKENWSFGNGIAQYVT